MLVWREKILVVLFQPVKSYNPIPDNSSALDWSSQADPLGAFEKKFGNLEGNLKSLFKRETINFGFNLPQKLCCYLIKLYSNTW